jgi:hypothetical protein
MNAALRSRTVVVASALFLFTVASRWPIRFEGFGEKDHSRFVCDVILYGFEGGAIFRKYFLMTSPLAVVVFSWVHAAAGPAALLPVSNAAAVLAAGVTCAAAYVLARGLVGGSDARAAGIAAAATFAPGVFFASLYGYPSIYALAPLTVSVAALSEGVAATTVAARRIALGVCAAAFVTTVLLKVDFILMGTWLLAVALQRGRAEDRRRNVLFLVALAVATAAITYAATTLLAHDPTTSAQFGGTWARNFQPYAGGFDARAIIYATGRGTWLLLTAALAALAMRGRWREAAVSAGACLLAAGPLWSLWATMPPLSTRHCLPGALATALYAGVACAKLFPRTRLLPLFWPVLLVASNWWGTPWHDVNYYLSGNLLRQYRVNRAAFAAADRVADRIAADPRPVLVWVGPRSWSSFGHLDIIEMVRYRFACEAVEMHNRLPGRSEHDLYTRRADGSEKILLYRGRTPGSVLGQTNYPKEQYYFVSTTLDRDPEVEALGAKLTHYDVRKAYREGPAPVPVPSP